MSLIESHFSSDRSFSVLSISLILILTGIVYANSLRNDFTNWDDPGLVVENRAIRSLDFQNILQIFTPSAGHTYQPVRVLSYAIDYHFWELNPMGYHIGNALLHAVSAIFLYLVLVKVLNAICPNRSEASNRLVALVSTLLFVVHPVNVESVAWLSSRKYGLLAFFSFLSLYFFIRSSEKKRQYILCYSFSIAAYALALLSSPVSVTLVGLFFLYDYCRSGGKGVIKTLRNRFLCYVPFGLMTTLYFAIQWHVLTSGSGGAVKAHHMDNPVYTLLTMLQVLFDYIKNLFLPFWLNNRYPERVPLSVFETKVMISIVLLLGLAALLMYKVRQGKKLSLFCVGWFFITLSPVLNIIPISTKMADRYLYLPAIGIFLWVSSCIYDLLVGKEHRVYRFSVFLGLVITIVFTFSILTFQRNKVWKNGETLWTDSLKKDPVNSIAHNNMGNVLAERGNLDKAIDHYFEALRIHPDFAMTHNNLGNALRKKGKQDEAISHYTKALRIEPTFAEAHNNLGSVLADQGRFEEAIRHCSEALQIKPDNAKIHCALAVGLAGQGRFQEAISHFSRALHLDPDFAEAHHAHNDLGQALNEIGRFDEAIRHFSEALRIKPNFAEAHTNLGIALARKGKLDEAITQFSDALRIAPDSAKAHYSLGLALALGGRHEKAMHHFSQAVKIDPGFAEAHFNLGAELASQGSLEEAIDHFSEALRIKPDFVQAKHYLRRALEETGKASSAPKKSTDR